MKCLICRDDSDIKADVFVCRDCMSDMMNVASFKICFDQLQERIHLDAIVKGWWEEDRNDGEMIALMHSELSEALEALREGNPASTKIEASLVEEELADVVIRIMDYCERNNYNLADAIVKKVVFNKTRSYKHGGKKF